MAQTTEEKRQRMLNNAQAAQMRARERAKDKLKDPQWRARQLEKKQIAGQRQRERQAEKQRSPEHQQKIAEKRQASWLRSKKTAADRKSKRGTKGRTPTADERRIMDALGTLPCIACHLHGVITEAISLHHINGRTKPDAHKEILPLCNCHHQSAAPAEVREQYPWLVPVHACGTVGGKRAFEEKNATQEELLALAYFLAGIAA